MASVPSRPATLLSTAPFPFRIMSRQEPVIHDVPVEIWRIIFRLFLGPSLSNPDRDGYHAYKHLFTLHDKIIESYKAAEQLRRRLSSVCRSWRLILADMDDEVVVEGPAGSVWPPGRSMERSKLAIRVDKINWITIITIPPIVPSRSAPFDPFQITETGLKSSEGSPILSNLEYETPTIKLLGWQNFSVTNDLQPLWHAMFRNLVALSIRGSYPFHRPNPSPSLQLPHLRCLFLALHARPVSEIQQEMISKWSFPRLETFRLTNLGTIPQLVAELTTILRNHASGLREVVLGGSIWPSFDISAIWPLLIRLELYQFQDLEALVQALPLLKQTPTVAHPPKRLFQVLLHNIKVTQGAVATITRELKEHGATLARLDIQFVFPWMSMLASGYDPEPILGILRDTGVIITDTDGWSSDRASLTNESGNGQRQK